MVTQHSTSFRRRCLYRNLEMSSLVFMRPTDMPESQVEVTITSLQTQRVSEESALMSFTSTDCWIIIVKMFSILVHTLPNSLQMQEFGSFAILPILHEGTWNSHLIFSDTKVVPKECSYMPISLIHAFGTF
ncbi:hypothetical protein Ocin01_18525 [Orchesella cincta]|uniref:Uncharacterized protein n=1 Tax=Orchesella cincta TaxID=48709 RepID=A0A1D2M5A0_ORCCI|nr:hypothetical protein Ocin01_18525 [Orchesella cincta]